MIAPDPVDRLLLDEAPPAPESVAIVDAPALVGPVLARTDEVRVFCDDLRDAALVPQALLVGHPDELGGAQLALARLPKSLAALDEIAVSVLGRDDLLLLAGGRVKHMHRSMNEVLAKYFTAVNASLGRQKSRVLRAWGPVEGATSDWPKRRHHEDLGFTVCAHGATFAGTKIDAGTRLLLQHLAPDGADVLDFGCGNGSIAVHLARHGHRVTAVDVSWAAVAATQIAAAENDVDVDAVWADGTSGLPGGAFDAIVTNPPFHRGVAKESDATIALFDDAARLLRPGGELWCVFNSHLPWRRELGDRLGPTRVVAQDPRYTVTVTSPRTRTHTTGRTQGVHRNGSDDGHTLKEAS